jgi:ribose transport system ATP-binding protein
MTHPTFGAVNVSKSYDGVRVLSDATLALTGGRVHSIVGENGAGKSTLMRILAGVTSPSTGHLVLNGEEVTLSNPRNATDLGIVMVHQELALVSGLSVADNIMLARPRGAPWRIRGSRAGKQFVSEALASVDLDINPASPVAELSVAQGYLVEIAKALALNARFIIFDEPTAALSGDASEVILSQIEALRRGDRGIAFISHRLNEVLRISDEITVMRDGRIVGSFDGEVEEDELIHLMVDRPVGLYRTELPAPGESLVLQVRDVSTRNVHDISMTVHDGEIIGLAGLVGSGRSEAALAIIGADPLTSGEVVLDGQRVSRRSMSAIRKAGIALVPEDRKHQGIVPGLSVHENLHVGNLSQFIKWGLLSSKELRRASDESKSLFDIRLQSLLQPIETLSGGNQQKSILARAIEARPRVLILDEPTRGVDVRAKDEIHKLIIELARGGTATILISSELEEVLALSHRVYVFAEGRIQGQLDGSHGISPDEVMRLATPKSQIRGGQAA